MAGGGPVGVKIERRHAGFWYVTWPGLRPTGFVQMRNVLSLRALSAAADDLRSIRLAPAFQNSRSIRRDGRRSRSQARASPVSRSHAPRPWSVRPSRTRKSAGNTSKSAPSAASTAIAGCRCRPHSLRSSRRLVVSWIASTSRPCTRSNRCARAVATISAGVTRGFFRQHSPARSPPSARRPIPPWPRPNSLARTKVPLFPAGGHRTGRDLPSSRIALCCEAIPNRISQRTAREFRSALMCGR